MADKPPPFTALRAIEAAVRHRSYTWAAKELAITHSAISQSIKRFEAELGTKLFSRKGGAMEPSPAALQLAQAYADAAAVVSQSIVKLAAAPQPTNITVLIPPAFGRLWLSPRLPRLIEFMADITVDLRTNFAEADAFEASDLVITIGPPKGRHLSVERLGEIMLTPACSQTFAARYNIRGASDCGQVPLIEDRSMPWSIWFDQMKSQSLPDRRQRYDDLSMVLDAAARGEGLALVPRLLARSWLTSGVLVAPVSDHVAHPDHLFAAWQGHNGAMPHVSRCMDWLRSELGQAQ